VSVRAHPRRDGSPNSLWFLVAVEWHDLSSGGII
jgi:hypothetical protein